MYVCMQYVGACWYILSGVSLAGTSEERRPGGDRGVHQQSVLHIKTLGVENKKVSHDIISWVFSWGSPIEKCLPTPLYCTLISLALGFEKKKLVKLSDDYASLNAGAILALKQGWPQVRLDGVVLLIRIVVTHMKVGPELASLVLDDVDGNLEIKFGHDSS